MNIIGKYQLLIIISTFFLIATSAVLFWGFDKGCDITDEGFCLLGYQNYQQAKVYVSSFLLIGDKTFAGADAGVFQLRMDKLLFTLGGSLFLALGVSLWLGQIYGLRKRHLYILNAVFLGSVSLLNFSVLYTVVSYNDMINLVLMITGGLYFMSRYFIMKDHHRIACFLTLLLGAVTGFAFFIKFSVSIIMMITYLILSWLIRGRGAAGKIGMIFSILLGYLLGWAGYFIFFQPAGEWFPVFSESMREWSTGH
ncbi:MAG: hypothetical protein JXB60_03760, partial [Candidatus Cloacimonetes bacterium]|nr:hypothetical protein [Candidatus Cloacimonadota bacterium]